MTGKTIGHQLKLISHPSQRRDGAEWERLKDEWEESPVPVFGVRDRLSRIICWNSHVPIPLRPTLLSFVRIVQAGVVSNLVVAANNMLVVCLAAV